MLKLDRATSSKDKMGKSRLFATLAILTSALLQAAQAADAQLIVQASRKFDPKSVTIRVGDTLSVTNRDDFIHEIYIISDTMNFESNEQSPGQIVTVGFPVAGTFTVRCHIHPRMALVVHVN